MAELNGVAGLKPTSPQPLEAALRKVKLDLGSGEAKADPAGYYVEFDSAEEYAKVVSQLVDGGKQYDLAVEGWVATYCGDTSDSATADGRSYAINFIQLDEPEPENTPGHKAEDDDLGAVDKIASASFKADGPYVGRKDNLRKADEVMDSLTKAADLVTEMLKR